MSLLELKDVRKQYLRGALAVDGVSLSIDKGETFALVGESGCGKSTLARLILGLMPPTGGQVVFDGTDLTPLDERQRRPYRRRMQMVFQEPGASLNPRWTIATILEEPFRVHDLVDRRTLRLREEGNPSMHERIVGLLERVGLGNAHLARYPHEMSGGQKQRVAIARAISLSPEFLLLDEPTSALDVSVQAQILNLLADLQEQLGLTYLFISHNLAVVRHLANRCAVMQHGKIVELGQTLDVLDHPQHPYTELLIRSIPPAIMKGTSPS